MVKTCWRGGPRLTPDAWVQARAGSPPVPHRSPYLRFDLLNAEQSHQIQVEGLDAMLMFGAIASATLHLQEAVERTPDPPIFAVFSLVYPESCPLAPHLSQRPIVARVTSHLAAKVS